MGYKSRYTRAFFRARICAARIHDTMHINESDIVIETTPASSADDPDRREMLWKTRAEELVGVTRATALVMSAKHEKAAWKARLLYQILGLCIVVLPLSASVASEYAPTEVNSALMLAAGVRWNKRLSQLRRKKSTPFRIPGTMGGPRVEYRFRALEESSGSCCGGPLP